MWRFLRNRRGTKLQINGYHVLGVVAVISIGLLAFTGKSNHRAAQVPSAVAGSTDGLSGVVEVVDGDTIRLGAERVRLYGIDAPEKSQPCSIQNQTVRCGELATAALRSLAEGRTASCEPQSRDRYGRTVAICTVGSEDIGAAMVRQGMAVAYAKYSTRYVHLEQEAQSAHKGIWAGQFQSPEAWRHAR